MQSRFTVSILPSILSSDTCLQSYNSILTLGKLIEFSDCSMIFNNDDL